MQKVAGNNGKRNRSEERKKGIERKPEKKTSYEEKLVKKIF